MKAHTHAHTHTHTHTQTYPLTLILTHSLTHSPAHKRNIFRQRAQIVRVILTPYSLTARSTTSCHQLTQLHLPTHILISKHTETPKLQSITLEFRDRFSISHAQNINNVSVVGNVGLAGAVTVIIDNHMFRSVHVGDRIEVFANGQSSVTSAFPDRFIVNIAPTVTG